MLARAVPVIKDLVLIGGGHAHVTVLKRFGMKPIPGVRLTVLSPDAHTPYSGMLPGFIAGHYTYDEAHIDLAPLCRFASARFFRTSVEAVDPVAKMVLCAGRPPVPYDLLSINSGSTPDPLEVAGAAGRVIAVKPVADFLVQWEALKQRVLTKPSCRIGVIGAGAGGIELILSAQFALDQMLAENGIGDRPDYHVVTQGDDILVTHNRGVRSHFAATLQQRGVGLTTGFAVDRVSDAGVHAADRTLEFDEIFWVTGAAPAPWMKDSGLAVDARGFLKVAATLQSTSHPDVFGVGDVASVDGYPRPKSGVFAVRQGPPLDANLRRVLLGQAARPFRPQSAFLSLISTGGKHAVASRGRWCFSGDWVWRWKDWIDRSFMDKFNKLPEMTPPTSVPRLPSALDTEDVRAQLGPLDMRCGGCGAKVGAASLSKLLRTLSPVARDDVVAGLDQPDDAAILNPPQGKLLVQTVDAFRTMVEDPFVFGSIAANHCLGDVYAMGGVPQSAMAIATLPVGLPAKSEALLAQMMDGAARVLERAGCALVGGHTAEGAELSLGFAITGLVDADGVLRKTGMWPGDALILTKPLGTGTLFAADMRAKAKGRWLFAAIETALHSNREAAQVLAQHGVRAATDVTGYGLLGHLFEMVRASQVAARLDLDELPAVDGALESMARGWVSSLQDDNRRFAETEAGLASLPSSPQAALLFDPQTAGGLLAAVPGERADRCVQALHAAGYGSATVIGHVTDAIDGDDAMITLG
ncbi:MAG: selenide, water dikinase SelD [Hyphomicrobiaceae bacterium]